MANLIGSSKYAILVGKQLSASNRVFSSNYHGIIYDKNEETIVSSFLMNRNIDQNPSLLSLASQLGSYNFPSSQKEKSKTKMVPKEYVFHLG